MFLTKKIIFPDLSSTTSNVPIINSKSHLSKVLLAIARFFLPTDKFRLRQKILN